MVLNKTETYEIAEELLLENSVLENPVDTEQYRVEPYEFFSQSNTYEQNSFRPSVIQQIQEKTENEKFSTKNGEILKKRQLSKVMAYLSGLFEDVETFSRTSDIWFMDEDIDYNQLENLSKVVYTSSRIASKTNTRPGYEKPVASQQDSLPEEETRMHLIVDQKLEEFLEETETELRPER